MTSPGRQLALCTQTVRRLTGIDFVQVVNPADQRRLRVFFVIEPDQTVPAIIAAATLPALAAGQSLSVPVPAVPPLTVQIETDAEGTASDIVQVNWRRVRNVIDSRVVLEVDVREPGGFEPYRLTLGHPQLDPLSDSFLFDFKQACETGFDCEAEADCPQEPLFDVDVDYLARDFDSIRRALLDFTSLRYPHWREPLEADFGAMMMEMMAAQGDHFAYQQDRIDGETRFASATQRASIAAHAKLVDYRPFRGSPASGPVTFEAIAGGVVKADSRLWAWADDKTPVPFSTLRDVWVHYFWNELPAHNPDSSTTCLGHGATSLMLRSSPALATQTPAGVTREKFLVGKPVMILSDPADPALPRRAIPVTITAMEEFIDPLVLTAGLPTFVTQIHWSRDEAITPELPYDGLTVAMNLVDVAAGQLVTDHIRVGDASDLAARYGALDPVLLARMSGLPETIEREGPLERSGAGRDIILRHGLTATENASLRHSADGLPDVKVEEVRPPAVLPVPLPLSDAALFGEFIPTATVPYLDDLLTGDLGVPAFTLDPGLWRSVQRHQQRLGHFAFRDYASNSGWTVRFAHGDFGQGPADGTVLRIRYRTDPGITANVPRESLALDAPQGVAPDAASLALVRRVVNPLPFNNARPEESGLKTRINAPEAYRSNPRRAVRPEDYESILGRMPFVQRANAVTRWTGSWSTDFVAVDPENSIFMTEDQRQRVDQELECIRLATRDVRRMEADYVDIDLDISVCVSAGAYVGEVIGAVREAVAAPGFFAPDNFTFGTPLARSGLEATVQSVAGVRFVDRIQIRVHRRGGWRDFTEAELLPAANQIIRLQNDPDRSAMGLLSVHSDRVVTELV